MAIAEELPSSEFIFFVDLEPEANWSHACAYVFVAETGETVWCDARWPPHASIPLSVCKSNRNQGGACLVVYDTCRRLPGSARRQGYAEEFTELKVPALE